MGRHGPLGTLTVPGPTVMARAATAGLQGPNASSQYSTDNPSNDRPCTGSAAAIVSSAGPGVRVKIIMIIAVTAVVAPKCGPAGCRARAQILQSL